MTAFDPLRTNRWLPLLDLLAGITTVGERKVGAIMQERSSTKARNRVLTSPGYWVGIVFTAIGAVLQATYVASRYLSLPQLRDWLLGVG